MSNKTDDEKHVDAAFNIEEGDHVTLTTPETTVEGECVMRNTTHSKGDTPGIWEQTMWEIRARDGETYAFGRIDGLSPYEDGGDAFPSFISLYRAADEHRATVPDEDLYGYITEVDK